MTDEKKTVRFSVSEIVADWLKQHGYDGITDEDECACELDDLMPCEAPCSRCVAAYKHPCDCNEKHEWHMGADKPEDSE